MDLLWFNQKAKKREINDYSKLFAIINVILSNNY